MRLDGDAVRAAMRARRLDDSQVAARMRHLGLRATSPSWLRIACRGNMDLAAAEILALAQAVDVPPHSLVPGTGGPVAPVLARRGHLALLPGGRS